MYKNIHERENGDKAKYNIKIKNSLTLALLQCKVLTTIFGLYT